MLAHSLAGLSLKFEQLSTIRFLAFINRKNKCYYEKLSHEFETSRVILNISKLGSFLTEEIVNLSKRIASP